MRIQTMSIVVGTTACNAKCPFCIAKTTPKISFQESLARPARPFNRRNFDIACKLADRSGATTALLTGKGEPTLFPKQISGYLYAMNENDCFPIRELQTNGIALMQDDDATNGYLDSWYTNGLTTISISAVHYMQSMNAKIYGKSYPDLKDLVAKLRRHGYTVRLSIMLLNGYIDTKTDLKMLIDYCRDYNIKQLTIRPITSPSIDDFQGNLDTYNWIQENKISEQTWFQVIKEHVSTVGNSVLKLVHGAEIFDYEGQNVCLTNCITTNESSEKMRQIIFHPDGTIGYDWKYSGAVLL